MIEKNDITGIGIEEENATKIIELLGDKSKDFTTESNASKRVAKVWDDFDGAILLSSKMEKETGEKTTDYYKRVNNIFIEQERKTVKDSFTKQVGELTTEIEGLKESNKGKGDEATKKIISDLEEELKGVKDKNDGFGTILEDKEKELNEKYETLSGEFSSYKQTNSLSLSLPTKFKELPDEFIKFSKDNALKKAMSEYDTIEVNENGETILKDSNFKLSPIKAKDFFNESLKEIIDNGNSQPGGGAGEGDPAKQKELTLTDEMSKGEKINKIDDYILSTKGITKADPEYSEIFKKLAIENKVIKEEEKK